MSSVRALLHVLAAAIALSGTGAMAEDALRTKHFDYRILSFRVVAGYGAYQVPSGRRLAVVEFEARNIDDEPRAVFIATLHAEHAGVAWRFDEPQPVPGLADKMFSELRVGERETMRFAYEVPANVSADMRWSWEPARSGGRRLALPAPVAN